MLYYCGTHVCCLILSRMIEIILVSLMTYIEWKEHLTLNGRCISFRVKFWEEFLPNKVPKSSSTSKCTYKELILLIHSSFKLTSMGHDDTLSYVKSKTIEGLLKSFDQGLNQHKWDLTTTSSLYIIKSLYLQLYFFILLNILISSRRKGKVWGRMRNY